MINSLLKAADPMASPIAAPFAKALNLPFLLRRAENRPLILRPGGMGDLILVCIAAEQLGIDLRTPLWLIEQRSVVWAEHLGLDYLCYDKSLLEIHRSLAGRFSKVINTEQLYGLSQAAALLGRGRNGKVFCFSTNRSASWADFQISYDPDDAHESAEFRRLLSAALMPDKPVHPEVLPRERLRAGTEPPIVGLGGLQAPSRAFSLEQWEQFIGDWIGKGQFALACSGVDLPFGRQLIERFENQAELFHGNFSQLCDRIARSEKVLTIDSGFLHIASYYGVPTTGIFTSGRERKWASLARNSSMVRRSDLACQPCTWFGQVPACAHNYACKDLRIGEHLVTLSQCRADRY
jgi:ADP-heptose:LPS heptosyltransferase